MPSPGVHGLRENLAEYSAAAERGEKVLICRPNQPVARLVTTPRRATRRALPLGNATDAGEALPDAFREPLPVDLLDALSREASEALARSA